MPKRTALEKNTSLKSDIRRQPYRPHLLVESNVSEIFFVRALLRVKAWVVKRG
jgi:hypothetical protein